MRLANVTDIDAILAQCQSAIEEEIGRVRKAILSSKDEAGCSTLVPAEVRVFRLMGLGLSDKEIAEGLSVSMNTVRTYAKRLHDKLAIEGRARLAVVAARMEMEA